MVPRLPEAWDEVGFPRAAPSRVIRAINSPSLGMNGLRQGRKITAPAEPGGWNSLFPVLFPAPCSAQAFLVGNSHEFGLKFRSFPGFPRSGGTGNSPHLECHGLVCFLSVHTFESKLDPAPDAPKFQLIPWPSSCSSKRSISSR